MSVIYATCSLDISEFGKNGINCSICMLNFHVHCAASNEVNRSTPWICNSCEISRLGNRSKSISSPMLMSKIDSIIGTLKEMKTTISKHEKSFLSLNSKMDNISIQISSLFEENKLINNRLNDLELKMSTLSTEAILSEIIERQSKSKNLIIFNAIESSTSSTFTDSTLVSEILSSIGANISPTTITRLGKLSDKPRPLKIVLSSTSDVFSVLKLKHKLRDISKFSSIRISSDRTLIQRNYFKNIVSQLEARRNGGERDLVLKYLRGVPMISKNGQTLL
jgi:hypothetical protein